MRIHIRIIEIICIVSMLMSIVACSASKEGGAINTTSKIADEEALDTTDERILSNLPDEDFGGASFTFLARTLNDPARVDLEHYDLTVDGETGEAINDAVYLRNRTIEDRFNVEIKTIKSMSYYDDIRKAVQAGDGTYDIVLPMLVEVVRLAQEGLFYDLKDVEYIDLSKPWYNQQAVSELTVGGRLFFMQGDLMIIDNNAVSAMIFNKEMLRDYALDDPYELVRSGKWTLDKLVEMSKGVAQDINGDGKMELTDDKFGIICQADSTTAFFIGAGERICRKDDNDYPVITFASSRSFDVLDKIFDLMCDNDNNVNLHKYDPQYKIYIEQTKMFTENRALFSWIRMRMVAPLRSMEADFGILPIPKYDEAQERYWNQINSYASAAIAIPKSVTDIRKTAIILEALSSESRYTLQPAYYDTTLTYKTIRDEESREMLDIIFNTTCYDIGEIYNFGSLASTIINYPTKDNRGYASLFEKSENKMQSDIEKIINQFSSIE